MPNNIQIDKLLLECLIAGFAQSCRNIYLTKIGKAALLELYRIFSARDIHTFCRAAFVGSKNGRLRQEQLVWLLYAQISRLSPDVKKLISAVEKDVCRDGILLCCCAIWIKEEARELGALVSHGRYFELSGKGMAEEPPPGAMEERRRRVLKVLDYKIPSAPASGKPGAVPAQIADIPFVQDVNDVADLVTDAFSSKGIAVKFLSNIVPAFYRQQILTNEMNPQQYLAGIVAILTEILPAGSVLTIETQPDCFVFESPAFGNSLMLDDTKVWKAEDIAIDSELLAACYTLWAAPRLILDPEAFFLPLKSAEMIQHKMQADAVYHIQEFFAESKRLRWKAHSKRDLGILLDFVQRLSISSLVCGSLQVREETVQFLSWPTTFRTILPQPPQSEPCDPDDNIGEKETSYPGKER